MLELRADTVIERQGVGASTLQLEGHVAGDAFVGRGLGQPPGRLGLGSCPSSAGDRYVRSSRSDYQRAGLQLR